MKPLLRTRPLTSLLWALMLLLTHAGTVAGADSEVKKHRNPFRTLSDQRVENARRNASNSPAIRPPGLKGTLISETSLVGIVSSGDSYLAMLETASHFVYIVKVGSRLFDGKVLLISDRGILFSSYNAPSKRSRAVFKPFTKEEKK